MSRFVHVLRCVIETTAPLSIATGTVDATHDVLIVRDAHGFPAIPGSSLAGVLRHALARSVLSNGDREALDDLFGRAKIKQSEKDGVEARREKSRLRVSWGVIHDQDDRPIDGPIETVTYAESHPVIRLLRDVQPVRRSHVKLNERGTAEEHLLFERGAVPAGTRFTFQMEIDDDTDTGDLADKVEDLLDVLLDPTTRIGGAGRRSYGSFVLLRHASATLDLRRSEHLALLSVVRGPLSAALPDIMTWVEPETVSAPDRITLDLVSVGHFAVGGEGAAIAIATREVRGRKKLPDKLPYSETAIRWTDQGAALVQWLVVPASSVKGALRHRTLFHLRCLRLPLGTHVATTDRDLEPLFGSVREGIDETASGRAGRVMIADVRMDPRQTVFQVIDHNGIDRFTGGVRRGILFSEQVIHHARLTLTIDLAGGWLGVPDDLRTAFERALDDLREERLALGAGASRGHGFFRSAQGDVDRGARAL